MNRRPPLMPSHPQDEVRGVGTGQREQDDKAADVPPALRLKRLGVDVPEDHRMSTIGWILIAVLILVLLGVVSFSV